MKDIDMKIEKAADATAKVLDEVTALSDEYGVQPELAWDILATLLDRAEICCCGHHQEDGCEISCEDDEDGETAEEEEDECPAEKKFYKLKVQYMNLSTNSRGEFRLPPDVFKELEEYVKEKGDGVYIYEQKNPDTGEIRITWQNPGLPLDNYNRRVILKHLKTKGTLGFKNILGADNHNVSLEVYEDGEVLIY